LCKKGTLQIEGTESVPFVSLHLIVSIGYHPCCQQIWTRHSLTLERLKHPFAKHCTFLWKREWVILGLGCVPIYLTAPAQARVYWNAGWPQVACKKDSLQTLPLSQSNGQQIACNASTIAPLSNCTPCIPSSMVFSHGHTKWSLLKHKGLNSLHAFALHCPLSHWSAPG
jgi:hypothetical protein